MKSVRPYLILGCFIGSFLILLFAEVNVVSSLIAEQDYLLAVIAVPLAPFFCFYWMVATNNTGFIVVIFILVFIGQRLGRAEAKSDPAADFPRIDSSAGDKDDAD